MLKHKYYMSHETRITSKKALEKSWSRVSKEASGDNKPVTILAFYLATLFNCSWYRITSAANNYVYLP